MARSSVSRRERVIVRQSYYWPDFQLNLWIIVMLGTAGTFIGIFASFITEQNALGLGIPWIMPYGITTGSLVILFVIIMLILISQRQLLPGFMIIGSFILLVLFITGLIETAIQLFGPAGNINGKCSQYVFSQQSTGLSIDTLGWLEQNNICQSWMAVFSFWVVGSVFLTYMIVLAARVAQGGFGDPVD